jgi:hypothetical protein
MKPAVASIAMGAVLVILEGGLKGISDAPLLAIMFLAGGLVYLSVFALLPGGRPLLASYWEYLNILRRGALRWLPERGSSRGPEEPAAPPTDGDTGSTVS